MKYIKEQVENVHYTRLREPSSKRRLTCKYSILMIATIIIIFMLCGVCLWRLIRPRSFQNDYQNPKVNCSRCLNLTMAISQSQSNNLSLRESPTFSQSQLHTTSKPFQVTVDSSTFQTRTVHPVSQTIPMVTDVDICVSATWSINGVTVAGGKGSGADLNQLASPRGAFVDDSGAIYITDDNLRVVKWERGARTGVIVAGFNGRGSNNDQFEFYLHNLAVDKEGTMFICDKGNERVMRWIKNAMSGEIILSTINCYGVTLDQEGSLYVSDLDKDLILRYRTNPSRSEIIAGGNGKGAALNQFNRPHFPFVDHKFNLFVPDTDNHRVIKWSIGSEKGIIVSEGNRLHELSGPHAVVVDNLGNSYVVDHDLHQVIRWFKDSQSSELLFGGHGHGNNANQLAFPVDIDFDQEGNLYVTDRNNNRIQMYTINKSSCHVSFPHNLL